ncbi:MAG TPA: hypothetical protein VFJ85_19555 [Acidimicrobiales bacterium]|nr:hypothetical protein [Acidimicrobiales bacterium]
MRRAPLAVLLAILVVAAAGCSRDDTHIGRVEVSVDRGSRVLAAGRGEALQVLTGRHRLARGAQLKVLSGSATVKVGDATLEVRSGSEVDLGDPVRLVAKDLLVTSGAIPLRVRVADSEVSVDGVARLTRDLAVSAATYKGTTTVRSAARALRVPALRQVDVPSLGVLPATPEALNYSTSDAWDRRYLSTAMELSDQLESRSKGFTRLLRPGEGRTPGFYRLLLPALENQPAFDEALLDDRPPGDTLVGAAIVVNGTRGSFAERWEGVFGFRAEGATWGLVAVDQGLDAVGGLVGSLDKAIGAHDYGFEQASARPAVSPPAPAVAPVDTTPPPPATPAKPPATPTTTPPRSTPPTTAPPLVTLPTIPPLIESPPADQPGLLTPLLTTVTNTVDTTLGGLLGAK